MGVFLFEMFQYKPLIHLTEDCENTQMCPPLHSMNAFEANLMKTFFLQNPRQSYSLQWKFSAIVIAAQLLIISTFCKHTNISTLIEIPHLWTTSVPQPQRLVLPSFSFGEGSHPEPVRTEALGSIVAALKSVPALAMRGLRFHVLNSNTFM